jgi:hypothetical protein
MRARIGPGVDRRIDERAARGDARDQPANLGLALDLQTIRPIIAKAVHAEQVAQVVVDLGAVGHGH